MDLSTNKIVKCESCGYEGTISTFDPSISVYSDIRCPKCNSTNNKHNKEYLDNLQKRWKETET
jgi:predicted Zn-ribbon and HTH transcriptional regulator